MMASYAVLDYQSANSTWGKGKSRCSDCILWAVGCNPFSLSTGFVTSRRNWGFGRHDSME